MTETERNEVTRLLGRWAAGDRGAADRVVPLLYEELHRIAVGYQRRERDALTLQPTAIVHEAWIQLFGSDAVQRSEVSWHSRTHFLGVAARVMRQVLVDHGRARRAVKRGGRRRPLPLGALGEVAAPRAAELVAIDDALRDLEAVDPSGARLVELRFFGGLTIDETAEFLGLSRKAVVRRWRCVRAWLHTELECTNGGEVARAI